ncbi:neutral/alkaline non-lysosomal ceramidase N-terminal domain-containing protein [Chengkuizengella sediminis]|uniref:neutral/alkaline non-lysosomal ceramidase N-terminal domain-containing protein n=1 Tax=Chengkuizengella sediminis TaxID=1885917 RepID=UPI00138A3C2A|nr:neutral/alkaline non-lysosomal ceramidase N-terminal domain-containing protein [Chengkuizengella sediminis]NDI35054.1 hypothetical protein [Chengkuizengella sediminis]
MNDNLYVGFSKVDISPVGNIPLMGYHRPSDSTGILDRLYCRTMMMKKNNITLVIVTIENVGFTVDFTKKIRKQIAYELKLTLAQIMVCFTHTHSAPTTISDDKRVNHYCESVETSVHKSIREALHHLEPAEIGWETIECKVGVNRRIHQNGYAVMGDNEKGPVDHRVPILKVVNRDSKNLFGVFLRIGVHANVLKGDNLQISGDLPGWISTHLEKILGCPILTSIGAAGNINPRWRGQPKELSYIANLVVEKVKSKIPKIKIESDILIRFQSNELPFQTIKLSSYQKAENLAREAMKNWGVDTSKWLAEIKNELKNDLFYQLLSMEIQTFQIGKAFISGFPAEIFAETALKISEKLNNNLFFFGGYTNGYTGYLPSKEEFAFGGYEVDWNPVVYGAVFGRLLPLEKETEDRIISYFKNNFGGESQ